MTGKIIIQTHVRNDDTPQMRTSKFEGWYMVPVIHFVTNGIQNINTRRVLDSHYLLHILMNSTLSSSPQSTYAKLLQTIYT